MTSFGWKKKFGENICESAKRTFEFNVKDDESDEIRTGEVDWLTLAPKRRNIQLEDGLAKSQRLKQEGEILAESERYWEALKKWEEAIQLTPDNEILYELKAQAYMALNEVYPAINAATKAVELNNTWWVGYQTLGRAHLNLGEVRIAIKQFSKAIHLYPASEELWTEDLNWALDLLKKKTNIEIELKEKDSTSTIEIIELHEKDEEKCQGDDLLKKQKKGSLDIALLHMKDRVKSTNENSIRKGSQMKKLPQNYVVMRD